METPASPRIEKFELFADLSSSFDARELAAFAIEAVHRVKPGSSTFQHSGQVFSEPVLLTVLTYCYASGVYASSEVEQAIQENEIVHYLCARVFPDAEDLRQFRRRNALALKESLAEFFSLAANHFASASRKWQWTAEAERRVTRAIQADSIAMDG